MEVLKKFIEDAKKVKGTVIFAEGDEERTVEAGAMLLKGGICRVVFAAQDKNKVNEIASKKGIDISGSKVIAPSVNEIDGKVLEDFIGNRKAKGVSEEDAKKLVSEQLYFAALYVKSGKANGCVAGAKSSTPDVLRAAIQGIGAIQGSKLISSFFLMVPPDNHPYIKKPIIYSDCGVNPDPNSLGLRDIALASIRSFKSLFPEEFPYVGFLSFSTKGSASHKSLGKVLEAVNFTRELLKDDKSVMIDGELQFDAAMVPSVAQKKCPDSKVAGKVNIFIFPDLNAGNICYKVTERLGGFKAIGPIVQGLSMPMNDLSRGCSAEDIYHSAVITLLQSKASGNAK